MRRGSSTFPWQSQTTQNQPWYFKPVYLWRHALHIQLIFYECTKNGKTLVLSWKAFLIFFSYYYLYIFTAYDLQKNTHIKFCVHLFILRLVTEFIVARMHITVCWSFPPRIKRSSGSSLQGVPLSLYCAPFRGRPFFSCIATNGTFRCAMLSPIL